MSDLSKADRCPGCRSRLEGLCPGCASKKEVPTRTPGSMTYEQIEVACANIGYNLDCGACAALFFAGFGGYDHDGGCSMAEARSPEPTAVEETRIVWRRRIGDFVTDVLAAMGVNYARLVANDIAYRLGSHTPNTENDRAAAISWTYGKPAFEMDEAFQKFVKIGLGDAKIPAALHRLATAFAEVRAEIEEGKGKG